jgi:hypothetical protein
MTPPDHEPSLVALPAGHRQSLVLVTSDRLRHLRLGYLMQQRFPGLLTAWFTAPMTAPEPAVSGLGGRLASTVRAAVIALKRGEVAEVPASAGAHRIQPPQGETPVATRRDRVVDRLLAQAEQEMFAHEIERLSGRPRCVRPRSRPCELRRRRAPDPPLLLVVHGAAVRRTRCVT